MAVAFPRQRRGGGIRGRQAGSGSTCRTPRLPRRRRRTT